MAVERAGGTLRGGSPTRRAAAPAWRTRARARGRGAGAARTPAGAASRGRPWRSRRGVARRSPAGPTTTRSAARRHRAREKRTHACPQLQITGGARKEVVGAGFEGPQQVGLIDAGADHDHRQVAAQVHGGATTRRGGRVEARPRISTEQVERGARRRRDRRAARARRQGARQGTSVLGGAGQPRPVAIGKELLDERRGRPRGRAPRGGLLASRCGPGAARPVGRIRARPRAGSHPSPRRAIRASTSLWIHGVGTPPPLSGSDAHAAGEPTGLAARVALAITLHAPTAEGDLAEAEPLGAHRAAAPLRAAPG